MIGIILAAAASHDEPITMGMVEFFMTVAGSVGALAAFIWDQARRSRNASAKELRDFKAWVYRVLSKHNKEDDENFGAVNDNIHQILVRNARVDGDSQPNFKTIRKRRYLVNDGGDISHEEAGQEVDENDASS